MKYSEMTEEQKIKHIESVRRWKDANKDKVREYARRSYLKRKQARITDPIAKKEKTATRKSNWQATHREQINARRRERYATDPEYRAKVIAMTNKWRTSPKGRAKFNEHMREYLKRPGVKEKRQAYVKAYCARPEVKARHAAYARGYAAGVKKAKAEMMKHITTRVIHEFTK